MAFYLHGNLLFCADLRPGPAIVTTSMQSFSCWYSPVISNNLSINLGIIAWVMLFITFIPATC
jgi:hypothetical protein